MDTEERSKIFEPLHGNEQLKRYLLSELENDRLSHAYIIEGAEGSGKFTLSLMLAAALEPEFSHKILSENCVDVTVTSLADDRKSIGITAIRELKYQASILPQELSKRIFVIKDAQTLTVEAQNSLLKILEEPPSGVYFFLLCENASMLLPTVRSRAPILRMEIFDEETLARLLTADNKKAAELASKAPEEFSLLIKSSGGTLGSAMAKLDRRKDARCVLRGKTEELISLLRDGRRTDVLLFFSAAELDREELSELLCYLGEAVRDLLAVKKCENVRLLFYLSREKADEDSFNFASGSLLKIYEATEELLQALASNVNSAVFGVRCANILTASL